MEARSRGEAMVKIENNKTKPTILSAIRIPLLKQQSKIWKVVYLVRNFPIAYFAVRR